VVTGPGLPECRVHVDTRAPAPRFWARTHQNGDEDNFTIALRDPFDTAAHDKFDRRVEILSRLCRDLLDRDKVSYTWYKRAIALWDIVEARASHR
jgi:hypothetical protein